MSKTPPNSTSDAAEQANGTPAKKSRFHLTTNDIFTFASRLHVSKFPLFLLYNIAPLTISGEQTREVIQAITPGDLLARFHSNALDRWLLGGTFQEMALYLGKVSDVELKKFARVNSLITCPMGEQMVIRATPTGLILEDLISFCRCDGLAVMRLPPLLKPLRASEELPIRLHTYFNTHLHPDVPPNPLIKAERELAMHLLQGKSVKSANVLPLLYRLSLNQLGVSPETQYDFLDAFGFDRLHTTVSSAFIYFVCKSFSWQLDIEPHPHRVWGKPYRFIAADDYVDNVVLEEVWKAVG